MTSLRRHAHPHIQVQKTAFVRSPLDAKTGNLPIPPAGADASACFYSLVEMAKANGLEPYGYLNALLTIVPGSDYRINPERMEQLMPLHDFMQALRA